MLREVHLKYTPFNDLREDDEFIRVAGRPVLLRDVQGRREGERFAPQGWGDGRTYPVHVMRMMPRGWLKEIDLTEGDDQDNPLDAALSGGDPTPY